MANIFIIHGAYGHPNENWFPWLKRELELVGHTVYVPSFPTPENQSLESWRQIFKTYERLIDPESIVVGHSLGPLFLLDVLERIHVRITAAFFVASVVRPVKDPMFDEINKTFVERKMHWDVIKDHCKTFYVYNSDDDPYIPLEHGRELAENLGTTCNLIKGAGHFNEGSGYTTFTRLLEDIRDLEKHI